MMIQRKISLARLTEWTEGFVELQEDWKEDGAPPLSLLPETNVIRDITSAGPFEYGRISGYCRYGRKLCFVLDPAGYPWLDVESSEVYVAGPFSGWNIAVTNDRWRMEKRRVGESMLFILEVEATEVFLNAHYPFKFVTGKMEWLPVHADVPNGVEDEYGHRNLFVDPSRMGYHRFNFTIAEPIDLAEDNRLCWSSGDTTEVMPLWPGEFFLNLSSSLPLGAVVEGGQTTFRVFCPRASAVSLLCFRELSEEGVAEPLPMSREKDGVWRAVLSGNLHGSYYWYSASGARNAFSHFEPSFRILDPYALAVAGSRGPAIVVDKRKIAFSRTPFRPPAPADLVISEAHVRDLAANAPVRMEERERLGFTGLRKWVESKGFYLKRLGVNAVELQPLQEFDNASVEEYHWGYMTLNYFAPESSYSLEPGKGSGIRELQELVEAFHRQGIAVILDVVYNHVGEPPHLLYLDKLYYFELGEDGELMNWSGCGNDTRCRSPMMKRLILDSLIHFMEVYGVDGFRFDLAELVGAAVLKEIETGLKDVNPDVILIAEPWSFRGNIVEELKDTAFSSWNDGYRNFLREYVRGDGNHEGIRYFLMGSPGHFARWPAQTVNYTESHDDYAWIDLITENHDGNGSVPTANDRARTHLMAAILFSSVGIPMIAEGQDFMRSKNGVGNTYQRGDLNAIDYKRLDHFSSSHHYFKQWIHFRLSHWGELWRLSEKVSDAYFQFVFAEGTSAFSVVFNADGSLGSRRLLLALNAHEVEVWIPAPELPVGKWKRRADRDRFHFAGLKRSKVAFVKDTIHLPPLQCGLWTGEVEFA
ncbi:MAG: alpha-amylase family glycosyl hydrolase [Opitutales bacterium]